MSSGGLCRQSETLIDLERVADPARRSPSPECLYLTSLSSPSLSQSKRSTSSVSSRSPDRPKFDLNFEVITKVPSDEPRFGTSDCKIYRARRSPFVKHLSEEEKERYLFHLGSIKDSEVPELKKEIILMRKLEDLVGVKLEDLKPK